MTRKVMCMCLYLGVALSLRAAEQREYPCYRLAQAPALDGTIAEDAWSSIPEAGGFYILGKDEIAGSRPTSFKAGWTPEALYIAARCQEMTPALITAESKDGDSIWNDDSIEVFFQPAGADKVLQFVANSMGARWNAKGLENWQAKGRIADDYWSLELMIPFAVLGKTPLPGERWLFNLARNNIHGFNERYTSWPKLAAGFNEPANFAGLVFKEGQPGKDEIAAIEKAIAVVDPKAGAVTYDAAMEAGKNAQRSDDKIGVGFEDAYRLAATPAQKAQALLGLGNINYYSRTAAKMAGVRAIYERVLAIKDVPADTLAEAQYYIGLCYYRDQDTAAAKKAWQQVIAMPGAGPALVSESWLGIADLETEARNYAAARPIYQRVIEMQGASGTAVTTAMQKLGDIKTLEHLNSVSREILPGYYAHEPLAVTVTNVMPCVPWLKPGQQLKLRVLFIAYLDGIREVAQLAQRMELDPVITPVSGRETFLFKDYGEKYPAYYSSVPPGFDEPPSAVVQQEVERVLDGNYDALVLGSVNWSSFPQPVREKLLKKVQAGSTLIAKISATDDLLNNALKDRVKPDLSFLFPYQGLAAFSQYPDFQAFLDNTLQISRFGKGRIILLRGYDAPDYQMLTPGIAGNPDDMKLLDYDYYLAFIIHLLRYASGKEADCKISGLPTLKADRDPAVNLEFGLESKAKTNLTCVLTVRSRDNAILATQQQVIAASSGKQAVKFKVEKLPAGSYFADLKALDGDKVVDFGSSWLEVTSANNIAAVNLKGQYRTKDRIKGTVNLTLNGREKDLTLHIARRDNYTRVVSRTEFPANGTEKSFALPVAEGTLSAVQYLDVELRKGSEVMDRKTVSFRLSQDAVPGQNRYAVLPESAGKNSYLAPYLSADYERCGAGKVLNNLATELLNTSEFDGNELPTFTFENPRNGWVFVSLQADYNKAEDRAWVLLGTGRDLRTILSVSGANGKQREAEAMRYLPAGKYTLAVGKQGQTKLERMIVRSVPEMHFAIYPLDYSRFPDSGKQYYRAPIDWNFMRRHILANINVIVGQSALKNVATVLDWKKTGKNWIVCCQVPKMLPEHGMPTVEEAYKFWALGDLENPLVDGLIADEFTIAHLPEQQKKFEIYCAAIRQISENPLYQGKIFYPFIGLGQARCFQSTFRHISDLGFKLPLERYLNEISTPEQATNFITQIYDLDMEPFLEICAAPPKHIIHYFAVNTQPKYVCFDGLPDVDFKVFLDMQFNYLANAPACAGLYGLGPYFCDYADEETLRWMAKLYRHYGIEGKRDLLSRDPYKLIHLRNADFVKGLEDWKVAPAEAGCIKAYVLPKLGPQIEDRAGTDKGECLWMKRSAKTPNRFGQTVQNLTPGRVYSLRFYTYDLQNRDTDTELHALAVTVENGELLKDAEFQVRYANVIARKYYWFNQHAYLFRAKSDVCNLTISDWADEKNPGGPAGQEIVYDFIQIQPYLEENKEAK